MTEHTYPDRHPPGEHWATTAAWHILDTLKPGALNEIQRAYLAGLIAGALIKVAAEGPYAIGHLADAPKLP